MKNVSVVGLGYIGLPTAIMAAQYGYNVAGFDIDEEKVALINAGKSPVVEPGLSGFLKKVITNGTFKAYTSLQSADCFLVTVPTPFKEGNKANLTYVWKAGACIARVIKPNNLIILESTVPVGTTAKFSLLLEAQSELRAGVDFFVVHCPERVLPGNIFTELRSNDRVIGGLCEEGAKRAQQFYTRFVTGKMNLTDDKTAEMVKLVENASRDVQLAFSHELATICQKINLNPYEVCMLANKHPRVQILRPTCGVGGHCISVDPWFLIESCPKETPLMRTARRVNDQRPLNVTKIILGAIRAWRESYKAAGKKEKKKPLVAILGLTYKADIDDLRNSPALMIAKKLLAQSSVFDLMVWEPHMSPEQLNNLGFVKSIWSQEELKQADIIVILVGHCAFSSIEKDVFSGKHIIDTCGLLQERELLSRKTKSGLDDETTVIGKRKGSAQRGTEA